MSMTSYHEAQEEHIGHTEDDPEPTCFICDRKGWLEEYHARQEEKRKENKAQKREAKKIRLESKLKDVKQEIRDSKFMTKQLAVEYNQVLRELKRIGECEEENYYGV